MRAINVFIGVGEAGAIITGQTTRGDKVCSFTLSMKKDDSYVSWVRVNVYGIHVDFCIEKIKKGSRVLVQGELMNRKRANGELALTEVRALDIKLLD